MKSVNITDSFSFSMNNIKISKVWQHSTFIEYGQQNVRGKKIYKIYRILVKFTKESNCKNKHRTSCKFYQSFSAYNTIAKLSLLCNTF